MPLPLLAYAGIAGAGVLGYGIFSASEDIKETVKAGAEPFKKAVKIGGLGAGAFYARKVAKSTTSPTLKRVANVATLGAIVLIGKEAMTSADNAISKSLGQEKKAFPQNTGYEPRGKEAEAEKPKYYWSL